MEAVNCNTTSRANLNVKHVKVYFACQRHVSCQREIPYDNALRLYRQTKCSLFFHICYITRVEQIPASCDIWIWTEMVLKLTKTSHALRNHWFVCSTMSCNGRNSVTYDMGLLMVYTDLLAMFGNSWSALNR